MRGFRSRGFRACVLVVALALVAAACGGGSDSGDGGNNGNGSESQGLKQPKVDGKPTPGGEVVYGLEAETTAGWCLQEAQLAISGIQVARTIYDTLTAPDENGDIQPFLAESVTPNADYTQWTITLRDGVTFHDGSKLDATVVKNNIDAYRGTYAARKPLLFTFVFDNIGATTVVDPLTVQVTTKKPWVEFPWFLWSSGRTGIVGQAQLDSTACNKDLIGTGPFKLESWVVNDKFVAVKNPTYWEKDADGNQLPYLDKITYRPLPDGQARLNNLESDDLTLMHTSSASNIAKIRDEAKNGQLNNVESDMFAEVGYQMLNSAKPPFNSLTARQAVAYAINRPLLNQIQAQGIPQIASGPFAPGSVGYLADTGYPGFDAAKAKTLVAQYKQETGQDLKFTLTHAGDPETTQLANLVKEQLRDNAGIEMNLVSVPDQSKLIDIAIGGDFEAMTWRNHPGADPDTQYVWWYGVANPVNFARFNDPEINRLLDEGRGEPDAAKRKQIYESLNRQFAKQLWDLWASWTIWSVASQPNVYGVLGPNLPNGKGPFPGLGTGHPVQGMWIKK